MVPLAIAREPAAIIAILGPTASGKSALALEVAERFGGEIVSADSRLVYRGMDIGTAKPTAAERARVPHHLINVVAPDESYDLARWKPEAAAAIAEIRARGTWPIIVGGTALWTTALLDGWEPPAVPPDAAFRALLEARAVEGGVAPLLAELAMLDPAAAEKTGPNLRRIIRALEVIRATGQPFSAQQGRTPRPYRDLRLALMLPREELYRRIDARVGAMLDGGLVDEVRGLLAAGYAPDLPALTGIGYRQVAEYLRGKQTFHMMKQAIIHATHRYARHQLTWLRRDMRVIPIDAADAARAREGVFRRVESFIREEGT